MHLIRFNEQSLGLELLAELVILLALATGTTLHHPTFAMKGSECENTDISIYELRFLEHCNIE